MQKDPRKESLMEVSIKRSLGELTPQGALVVNTAPFTGRSTQERFIVESAGAKSQVDWGKINKPISMDLADTFFSGLERAVNDVENFVVEAFAGPFPVEVKTTSPWHAAFARNMFRMSSADAVSDQVNNKQAIQVFHSPDLDPRSILPNWQYDCAIIIDFDLRKIGICGTAYAGEIKKSVFTVCNYHLPAEGILPMHASANCMSGGDSSSVLFGLSGTGKTTLSAAKERSLIGDDEIIWTDNGLSNLEGGCYAKLIRLNEADEPQIFGAVNRPGAILENVVYDKVANNLDFNSDVITENTRGSYPIEHIPNTFDQSRESEAPKSIVFLTADAFGALPAVARLNWWQAQYHFMSGYTAKVAGTEKGIDEPQATFSACFGAPFMPRPATCYAQMLVEKARQQDCKIWLLNTGWMPGGTTGADRYPIPVSRRILDAIQNGELEDVEMIKHPVFRFEVPKMVKGVDPKYLQIPDGEIVDELASKFVENFKRFDDVSSNEISKMGGPQRNH